MAIIVVQAASNANNSASNANLIATFGSSVTAGNAIIIWAQTGGGGSAPAYVNGTATDGASEGFSLIDTAPDTTNDQYGALWFCNVSVGGFTTVTVQFSTLSGAGFSTMTVFEVSGLAASASDTGNTTNGATGSAATNGDTSGVFTPSGLGELIVAGFFNDGGAGSSWTAGTSPNAFTIPANGQTNLGGSNPHAMEYCIYNSVSPINPTITLGTTGRYIAIGWGFKGLAGDTVSENLQLQLS